MFCGCRVAASKTALNLLLNRQYLIADLIKRTPKQDDFYHLMNGKSCGEAWDAVSRYVYAALQGGSIMKGWTNDDRMMIACCNDGTRPVVFKIERIDIPESDEERAWLEKQDFSNSSEDAYTG